MKIPTADVSGFEPGDRSEWPLNPTLRYLNHGTVGVTPNRILELRERVLRDIESDPAAVVVRGIADIFGAGWMQPSLTRRALEPVARLVGGSAVDLAFVDNITVGANAVLRSLEFEPGDEVLITSLGYGGIDNAVRAAAARAGAAVVVAEMPPLGSAPAAFVDAFAAAISDRTRLAVIDHLAANSALVMPIAELVRACRQRGVLSLVDGAHVPGAIEVDIPAVGADFYVANLHKWAWAPRGIGLLWAAPEHREALHPPVTSWGYGNGFEAEFDFTGTRDPSNLLCVPAALELLAAAGADHFATNRRVALAAAEHLTERWQTRFDTPAEMIGPMVAVRLPSVIDDAAATQRRLRDEFEIEVPLAVDVDDAVTARVACQRYVTTADIEALGDAVAKIAGR